MSWYEKTINSKDQGLKLLLADGCKAFAQNWQHSNPECFNGCIDCMNIEMSATERQSSKA
jgi:hypothetical protein